MFLFYFEILYNLYYFVKFVQEFVIRIYLVKFERYYDISQNFIKSLFNRYFNQFVLLEYSQNVS